MTTLAEITKEKQQVNEALARVDAQREKLIGQLGELEAAERVLARYSKDTGSRRRASARAPATRTKTTAPAQSRGLPVPGPQEQLAASAAHRAWAIGCLPWQPARRNRKSPPHARVLDPIMSALSSPGTSGLAASKSATGSSTLCSRRGRSNAPRFDARKGSANFERSRQLVLPKRPGAGRYVLHSVDDAFEDGQLLRH